MASSANGNGSAVKSLLPSLPDENVDMIAATSVLQQQAADIRQNKINWQAYYQSQMISQEDFSAVSIIDNPDKRSAYFQQDACQVTKTLLSLVSSISKDKTIEYVLVLIDDLISEDKHRAEIFVDCSSKRKEPVWTTLLSLMNRQNEFIVNMAAMVTAKLATFGKKPMPDADLNFYLQFLKDQLMIKANLYIKEMAEISKRIQTVVHHNQHGHHDKSHHHAVTATGNQTPSETYRELSENWSTTSGQNNTGGSGANVGNIAGGGNGGSNNQATEAKQYIIPNNDYIQSVARCLQMMLRVDHYRFAFVTVDGISTLIGILSSRVNFQVQYQLIFCLWVLTFNPLLAAKMNKFNVIPILADIINDCCKEKVTRIILAVFRNLIEKPTEKQIAKEHCIAMVQCKVLKQLSIFEQRRFDDEDITADVEFLSTKLQSSVQDLSSFDEYATEVRSGRLEWSPVHKSAKFWRENAQRLNEKNYELLRIIVHLLQTSNDPLVLSVASFDVGEYVRHYPRGKHVIEQLGGKQMVMQLLGHEDPNVRYEALLAVQKLMVHNWEYLGKQLEKESENTSTKPGGTAISGKA